MIVRSLKIYVALIFSMLPILCVAEGSASDLIRIEQDSMTYELNSRTRTAKLMNGKSRKGRVMVPNTIKHKARRYKVTEIGDRAFYSNYKLKSITIGDEVTRIGDYAFYGCSELDSILFSDKTKLDTICECALDVCYSLKYMSLPKDFYSIAYNDIDIILRFWKINHSNLKQKKYPNWTYEKDIIGYYDNIWHGGDNSMDLDVFYIKRERDIDIYMYLNEYVSTSEPHIIDSLHIQTSGDRAGDAGDNGADWIGQLNDTTELIQLEHTFPGRLHWVQSFTFFVAVSPHKIRLVDELEYFPESCRSNEETGEDMVWTCFSDEFSCSISERKTNGFYEIDVETVEKMYDDDDGKEHVTSSTSWVLYYDGEEFVRRVKTSE